MTALAPKLIPRERELSEAYTAYFSAVADALEADEHHKDLTAQRGVQSGEQRSAAPAGGGLDLETRIGHAEERLAGAERRKRAALHTVEDLQRASTPEQQARALADADSKRKQ